MKNRFDNHVKFYRRREREKRDLRAFYDDYWNLYSAQLRRYCEKHPEWRDRTGHDFWEIFPNW